jgi:hypothetical protein
VIVLVVLSCTLASDLSLLWMAVGGGGLLGSVDEETAMMGQREEIKGVDIIYFKNVMLKFLEANSSGRTDQVVPPA